MSLLFSENVFNTIRDFGENVTDIDDIILIITIITAISVWVYIIYLAQIHPVDSITVVGQYTISNYSGNDYKVILLSKHKINGSIILENENDITDKLLLVRIPYS